MSCGTKISSDDVFTEFFYVGNKKLYYTFLCQMKIINLTLSIKIYMNEELFEIKKKHQFNFIATKYELFTIKILSSKINRKIFR